MPDAPTTPKPRHAIAPPDPARPPLKTNVFECLRDANTATLPLFPYVHAGALVTSGTLHVGEPDAAFGQFHHENSVDEVVMPFAEGVAGQAFVGPREHGVGSFLSDETDPRCFALAAITQRQVSAGAQREALIIRCAGCEASLLRHEFDAGPSAYDARDSDDDDDAPVVFATIAGFVDALERFNAAPALRRCAACGRANDAFPLARWGWRAHLARARGAARARRALAHAASTAATAASTAIEHAEVRHAV